jgi:hypothetical protein
MRLWQNLQERAAEERAQRQRTWQHAKHTIEKLAADKGTPLNDTFANGYPVYDLASHIAALERRIHELETGRNA